MMQDFKERQVARKTVYDAGFVTVYEDDILLPNNHSSKRVVVDHVGAAAVIPITKDGMVILVRQYRYAISAHSLEIPAGKKDFKEEDGLACAKRELEEEVAYTADTFEKLTQMYSAIGFSNEKIEIYKAINAYPYEGDNKPDEDEFVERVVLSIDEAKRLVREGKIMDAKTVIAVMHL